MPRGDFLGTIGWLIVFAIYAGVPTLIVIAIAFVLGMMVELF